MYDKTRGPNPVVYRRVWSPGVFFKKKKNGGNFLDFDSKALGDYPVMNRRVWSLGVFVKTFF